MDLTSAQMRAIELMIEQQERFTDYADIRRSQERISTDKIVREFYEKNERGAKFEMLILNKIGALLAPDSKEDLNLTIRF